MHLIIQLYRYETRVLVSPWNTWCQHLF